jgi:hypothetical protein
MPSEMILGVVRLDIASSQKPWGWGPSCHTEAHRRQSDVAALHI